MVDVNCLPLIRQWCLRGLSGDFVFTQLDKRLCSCWTEVTNSASLDQSLQLFPDMILESNTRYVFPLGEDHSINAEIN